MLTHLLDFEPLYFDSVRNPFNEKCLALLEEPLD